MELLATRALRFNEARIIHNVTWVNASNSPRYLFIADRRVFTFNKNCAYDMFAKFYTILKLSSCLDTNQYLEIKQKRKISCVV